MEADFSSYIAKNDVAGVVLIRPILVFSKTVLCISKVPILFSVRCLVRYIVR